MWPCLGNHDYETAAGQPWRDAFSTPANNVAASENYYSFDVGNAHVVVLDSNESTTPGSAQYAFLDQDLRASAATWKFVAFHHTIYSSGTRHGSDLPIRASLVPLFDAHAVDVVFMGHEHNYERTQPLRAGAVVPAGAGTVYVTTGGGGKELYPLGPLTPMTAHAESVHHFVRVTVDGDMLVMDMVQSDGTIGDSTRLHKGTTTTTTTIPPAPSGQAACIVTDCDDRDPCTVDACVPGEGCRHARVDVAILRALIDRDLAVEPCAGERLPRAIVGLLRRARRRVDRVATLGGMRRARGFLARALAPLRRIEVVTLAATHRHRLSAACADGLRNNVRAAEARGECLWPGA